MWRPDVAAASQKTREIAVLVRNFLLDGIFSVLPRVRVRSDGKIAVLLVRLDVIGDFVLWLNSAAGLRALYPSDRYRLVLLGNALWTDLALDQPFFDEVIAVEPKRLLNDLPYRLGVWRQLRARPWQLAINPTYSRHLPYDDAAIRVCGARERAGVHGDLSNQRSWEMRISNRWYTRLIEAGQPLMELERNAVFVRQLGLTDFRAALPELKASATLPAGLAGEKYYVVVPGAGHPMRQWPVEKYAVLMQKIWKTHRIKGVICGGRGEEALGLRLRNLLPDGVEADDLTGGTTLPSFAALIKGAVLLLANESGAVHIAAAVGTRSICFIGGGHYGRFVPYRIEADARAPLPVAVVHRMECYHCNWNCIYPCHDGAAPCLDGITVDDAWREVTELLLSYRQRT